MLTHRTARRSRASHIAFLLAAAAWLVSAQAVQAQPPDPRTTCRAAPGAEANATLFVRWNDEAWHQGRLELVPQLAGPAYVRHEASGTRTVTAAQYAQEMAALRAAIPDVRFAVHDCFAEGDRIWTRWTLVGTAARTGAPIRRMGSQSYRVSQGRLVETWVTMVADAAWPEVRALPAAVPGRQR
jgi:predicted ester cyclase